MESWHLTWLREREQKLLCRIDVLAKERHHLERELDLLRNEMNDRQLWSIDALSLPIRAENCLRYAIVTPSDDHWKRPTTQLATVADLLQWSRADLKRLKNLGSKSLGHIERALAEIGLALREF